MTQSVKVMVRCRPMNQKQLERDCQNVILVNKQSHQIGLKKISTHNTTIKYFAYDCVFDQTSTQQQIYEQSSFSLVQNVLNGYNGTIFAYGQTGCGKTYTMLGVTTTLSTKKAQAVSSNKQNLPVTVTSLRLEQETMGIIPRAFHQIMTVTNSQVNKKHLIQCTFIEIYNEEIHDLLGKDIKARINLQETPDGLIMKDLSVHLAKNISDMERYMEIGYKNRVIRQTSMNKESSRSHCIFTIRIEESEVDQNGVQKFRVGKLNLVDLAGSERQSKTNLKDEGIKEAAKINLSLSALGNVISALVDGKKEHIPYRDSKLTRILNDSLGGNTKTVMIATISPSDYNYEQTLSTLRYSSRAKFIQNKPIVNEDPKDTLLRKYEQEIRRLKMILEGKLPFLRENQTFYLGNDPKDIFNKFPELKNEENEAIMNSMGSKTPNGQPQFNVGKEEDGDTGKSKQNSETKQNVEVEELKKQLKFLQEIVKKQANTSPQVLLELQKINELKQKLKQQALKEEKYKQQEKKRQLELMNIQKNYQSLNDEVDSIKDKFQELRVKYVQTTEELKDAREAHEKQKSDILDALRIQQAENNKLMEILNVVLRPEHLDKLLRNCHWIENTKEWIVPKFQFSEKLGVVIPKLGQQSLPSMTNKFVEKQLAALQKEPKNTKLGNLIIEENGRTKFGSRSNQSLQKLKVERTGQQENQGKLIRTKSQSEDFKDMNLFQSTQTSKRFKNSYYSEFTKVQSQSRNKTKNLEKPKTEKYKFSLEPLSNIKVQKEEKVGRVSLDLQVLKREIMNEMKQKNRLTYNSRNY